MTPPVPISLDGTDSRGPGDERSASGASDTVSCECCAHLGRGSAVSVVA